MTTSFKIRDLRKKDQYKIDDAYLNGYAKLCGIFATAVYNSLSRHADFHTQECFPSIEKMAEQHNISKPSVIKGLKELENWGIISITKEKDSKTKRQLPNVYLLVDKSEWKPKPSRVNDIDTESRVNLKTEPSQSQEKSRVNDVDCKDTHIKDNTIKVIVADAPREIEQLIDAFKKVNPSYRKWFAIKAQRDAAKRLIESHTLEQVIKVVNILTKTNTKQFLPTITTPIQLEDKWAQLESGLKRIQSEKLSKNKTIGIII